MGRLVLDESLLSTASTLVDSCSMSVDPSVDRDRIYRSVAATRKENKRNSSSSSNNNKSNNNNNALKVVGKVKPLVFRKQRPHQTISCDTANANVNVNTSSAAQIVGKGNLGMIITPSARTTGTTATTTTTTTTTTNGMAFPSDHSVGASTTNSNASRLDVLRARNNLLRKQSSQKISDSRASLCKTRTPSFDLCSPPRPSRPVEKPEELLTPLQGTAIATAVPPPGPPPSMSVSMQKRCTASSATLMIGTMVPGSNEKIDLPFLLRRSNSLINQLSTEIATAGDIMSHHSGRKSDTNPNSNTNTRLIPDSSTSSSSINDGNSQCQYPYQYRNFSSPSRPIVESFDHENMDVQIDIDNNNDIDIDADTFHTLSFDEDWDQSTISASAPCEPLSPLHENITRLPPPQPQSTNSSGLPPPEVVVTITSPRSPTPQAVSVLRHHKQRPPSISPRKGDCASMYNTNQKVEKLSIENDCLKRQLEILESRHRDWQRKMDKHLLHNNHEQVPEALRTPGSPTISTASEESKVNKSYQYNYSNNNRRRSKGDRRRHLVLLLVAPLLIGSTLWFFRAVQNASLARRNMHRNNSNRAGSFRAKIDLTTNPRGPKASLAKPALDGLASLIREGVLRQTALGPILFRDKSNGRIKIEDKEEFTDDNNHKDTGYCDAGGDVNAGADTNTDINTNSQSNSDADYNTKSFDYTDALPVLALPKKRRITGGAGGRDFDSNSEGSRLKRWFQKRVSKLNIKKENDMSGVWLNRSRQIKTRKLHEEL